MASSGNSGNDVRVPIGIPVDTNAKAAAGDVDQLRDAISRSKDVIKTAAEQMRNLSGKSDAVKAAKDQLKATIDREKASITQANVALIKQGQNFEELAKKQAKAKAKLEELKKAREDSLKKGSEARIQAMSDAMQRAGGPIAKLGAGFQFLSQASGEGASGLSFATVATGGLVVAAAAASAAIAGLLVGFAKWAIGGADVAKSMQLVREASTQGALNAENLGTQVTALANKVPTSTAALNDLAASLARSGISGQQAVDTLNAVAQANSAVGDSAGAKIREIVDRGKTMQRMFLGLRELQGTGLDFQDVAGALAKDLGVGVKDAQKALLEGRVKLADGAKAMRTAVESKFGGINLQKMMTLEGLTDVLHKKMANLTSGINLDKAGKSVFQFLEVFDQSTATGRVLQRAVTVFGQGIVNTLEKGGPIAKQFIRGLIIGGLEIYVGYLQVKKAFKDTFGDVSLLKNVDTLNLALTTGKVTLGAMAVAAGVLGAAAAAAAAPFVALGAIFVALPALGENLGRGMRKWFLDIDWKATGLSIIDGIIDGLKEGPKKLAQATFALGDAIKNSFEKKMGIRSPSLVMANAGKQLPAGVVKGVESGQPQVDRAITGMVAPPSIGAGGGGLAGGPRTVTINVNATIVLQGGGDKSAMQQVQDPGLLAELTKVIKDAAGQAGLGVVPA